MCTFASEMYISKAKKYRDQGDGTAIAYDYYRLTKSYIDKDGKTKHRSVLCLGELPGFDKDERNRLASMLTTMIEDGQSVMCDNKKLYEEAMSQYVKYRVAASMSRRTILVSSLSVKLAKKRSAGKQLPLSFKRSPSMKLASSVARTSVTLPCVCLIFVNT